MDTSCQYDQQGADAKGKTYFDPYKFLLPRMKSKLPRRLFQDTPEIQVQLLTNLHVIKKKSDSFRQWKIPELTARTRKRTMLHGTSPTNNKSLRTFRYRLNPGTSGYALRLQ
jgi:hypothetical protein